MQSGVLCIFVYCNYREIETTLSLAGSFTVFTPSFAGQLRSPSSPNVLRRLKAQDPANSSQPSTHPLAFIIHFISLDSVVHDGSSENPPYVIDTDNNNIKVRRSNQKGFVTSRACDGL